MATENIRIAAYFPPALAERLKDWSEAQGIKSQSAAVIALAETFFGTSGSTPDDSPSDSLNERLAKIEERIAIWEFALQDHSERLERLEPAMDKVWHWKAENEVLQTIDISELPSNTSDNYGMLISELPSELPGTGESLPILEAIDTAAIKSYVETIDAFQGRWWNAEAEHPKNGEVWLYCTKNMTSPAIVDIRCPSNTDSVQEIYYWNDRSTGSHSNCTREDLHIRLSPNPSRPLLDAAASEPELEPFKITEKPWSLTKKPWAIALVSRNFGDMLRGEMHFWAGSAFTPDFEKARSYRSRHGMKQVNEAVSRYSPDQYCLCLVSYEWLKSLNIPANTRCVLSDGILPDVVLEGGSEWKK
jgi:hypothetical protein